MLQDCYCHTYFWAVSHILLCITFQPPSGWVGIISAQPFSFWCLVYRPEFNLCSMRPENFVSHDLRVLQVPFEKLQVGCYVPFTEEWLPSGPSLQHSTTQACLMECCRDAWTSWRFSSLHKETLELCYHLVPGHLPDLRSSPLTAQFGQVASSRKNPGGSNLLIFMDDGGHSPHWNLQCCRICPRFFPDLCLDTILSQSSADNYLDLMPWFVVWHALSTVGHYIDRCVPF